MSRPFSFLAPFLLVASLLFASGAARAEGAAPAPLSPLGLWQTADAEAVIEIYACEGAAYCGRFYWLKDDSAAAPSLDDKNPDPVLRKRHLCGLTFMGGFEPEGDGRFGGGWIYSARHGATFSAELKMTEPTSLDLRGYVFLPFLGGGQTWHRLAAHDSCAKLNAPVSQK